MPVAWFLAPYKRRPDPDDVIRYCAMDDFTGQLRADNGVPVEWTAGVDDTGYRPFWACEECLGNMAVVKVRASAALLQTINQTAGFTRIPLTLLNDPVSMLTSAQQQTIQSKLLGLGYTGQELQAAFPQGWNGPYTLRDMLRFALRRRFRPRYDQPTDTIVLDGPQETPASPDTIDAQVT